MRELCNLKRACDGFACSVVRGISPYQWQVSLRRIRTKTPGLYRGLVRMRRRLWQIGLVGFV